MNNFKFNCKQNYYYHYSNHIIGITIIVFITITAGIICIFIIKLKGKQMGRGRKGERRTEGEGKKEP